MTVMRRRRGFVFVFFIFLFLSIILLSIFGRRSTIAPIGVIEIISTPVQRVFVGIASFSGGVGRNGDMELLKRENLQLRTKALDLKKIEKEMDALRDQFNISEISTRKLLPAQIVGRRGFIPGTSIPDVIVIDKGSDEGVRIGQVVIYEEVVLGKISNVSSHLSEVLFLWSPLSTLTAQTINTNANGILKGKGKGEMVLQNVVLKDRLNKGDSVVTKGDVNLEGLGFPPDLLIGKIVSVDRKQSALFQTAEVKTIVDVDKISGVFVIVEPL